MDTPNSGGYSEEGKHILFRGLMATALQLCEKDDLKIYRPLQDPAIDFRILQNDLNAFSAWSKSWQLDISYKKCRVLHVNFHHECFLRLDNEVLPSADDGIRDLGVKICPNLHWNLHCTEVATNALKVTNCILRALQHRCIEHYRKAYIVYCRPILEYCTQAWSPYLISDIKTVENVQEYYTRMAFRKLFVRPYTPDYRARLKMFDLEPLEYRRLEFDLALCFKIVRGFSDIPLGSLFTLLDPRERRPHRYQLARKTCSANSVFYCFQFRVVRIWDELPCRIAEAQNLSVFMNRLDSFDLRIIADLLTLE
ncbi:unnamed protein product [Toxocara canis]|uniref:RNA-directed DNA polymerase from mobile element jockey n=1 Tax=Toxocara canis TaxID=6265 RepID=A0A183V705_TOXCA|nr:unnamed protein product [Toxocara canis]